MQDKIWNKLLEFETRDLASRYMDDRHNRKASANQILGITSNFIQGREYFRNAKSASITVRPLLQYYGVTALTRGLILLTNPKLSESALKPAHGLETINWQEALVKKNFDQLQVRITNGTFYELLEGTANKSYFRHNSSGVNYKLPFDIPKLNSQIKFIDLIQTLPDFKEEFEIWSQVKLNHLLLKSIKTNEKSYQFKIEQTKDFDSSTSKIFPQNVLLNIDPENQLINSKLGFIPQFSQKFADPFNANIGTIALTRPISGSIYLNTIAQFYVLSYFLGMLSRYFPSIWISIGRTEKGDAIYPLITKIMDSIDLYFPYVINEYLIGPYPFEIH
ncbi:MAG: hypothetical protein HWE21_06615 [Cytophagia bacterium]|nr:hypothetical protein [Cytophagia bacterium]